MSNLIGDDGAVLLHRSWSGNKACPTIFIGHTQPTHSAHFSPLAQALNRKGWSVHSGDLRGHGGSVSTKQRLAHLDAETGWDQLIADMDCLVDAAFKGVPFDHRVLAVQNITALLALELLKSNPSMAGHIIMTPPAFQPELGAMTKAFIKARMNVVIPDVPDTHALHHFYTIWGAQLSNAEHLADVMSADRAVVDKIVADPHGFPTPTTSYWAAMFDGYARAWSHTGAAPIDPRTRFLLLYGEQDFLLANGGFIPKTIEHLESLGAGEVASLKVKGGRTAILLDEPSLSVSTLIADWVTQSPRLQTDAVPQPATVGEFAQDTLTKLGLGAGRELVNDRELVRMCYDAIDDETVWIQLLYQFMFLLSADSDFDAERLENSLRDMMPHWQRAFNITRQLKDQAALGIIVQSLVERLALGTALLSTDCELLHCNRIFTQTWPQLLEDRSNGDETRPGQADLFDAAFKQQVMRGDREVVLKVAGKAVGYYFRPDSLAHSKEGAGRPAGMLVLRLPATSGKNRKTARISMLELAFGLTHQEAVVADAIADGSTPAAIAEQHQVAISTVRSQLKQCYEKLDVAGQTALAAAILASPIGWLVD